MAVNNLLIAKRTMDPAHSWVFLNHMVFYGSKTRLNVDNTWRQVIKKCNKKCPYGWISLKSAVIMENNIFYLLLIFTDTMIRIRVPNIGSIRQSYISFKGTLSLDFRPIFLLKRFDLSPIWTGKKWFSELFRFRKNIQSRTQLFCLETEVFICLNYCFWVCTFFHLVVPLKSVRSL